MEQKRYSITDFTIGDIYEHCSGGFWMVSAKNKFLNKLSSIKVNSNGEVKEHYTQDVKALYSLASADVDSEAECCSKSGCNRPKLDGNVYCSYHYEVNFGG